MSTVSTDPSDLGRRRVLRRHPRRLRRSATRYAATCSACAAAIWVRCPRSWASSCCSWYSGCANDRFLSALNLANLVTQAGSICVLAMGLVFVLLLGDIDLSAGVAGGVSACAMALIVVNLSWPWWARVLAGNACGALIGLAIGVLRAKLGIPSFVVTLAFFLGLQGVTLKLIGEGGSVRVDDPVIRGLTIEQSAGDRRLGDRAWWW